MTANAVDHTMNVAVPSGWSLSSESSRSSYSLVDVAPGESKSPSSFLRISVQPRLDRADALKQIREYSSAVPPENQALTTIGGWPALEIQRVGAQPLPDHAEQLNERMVLQLRTMVAVGSNLVIVSATLPSDASPALVAEARAIASSLEFAAQADPLLVEEELKALRARPQPDLLSLSSIPGVSETDLPSPLLDLGIVSDGANARINTGGFGELEIATDPTGQHVVVALQSRRWVSSNDGGSTFPNNGIVGAGNGDPSIAWGQSGRFYMAWIHTNCQGSGIYQNPVPVPDLDGNPGPDPIPHGLDCTGIARSDDDGVTFVSNNVNPAVVCVGRAPAGVTDNAGECFPDQEHIAADRVNSGVTPNDDQVYSTHRNFSPSGQDAALTCSSDSGVTWTNQTNPIEIDTNTFFPRITVGPDGFVYVATYDNFGMFRLHKFTSCVNGLNPVMGFPVNVQAADFFQCPFAGHDRCDQNPTSQTVIVDGTNPNHVYYAFADDAGNGSTGDSNIIVRDSVNGGASFPRSVQANVAVSGRRIMPWLCTTGGDAVVTWYEQTGALPSDTTDFAGARVGIDQFSNLVTKEAFTISEVTDNWCDIGWQCLTRWGNTDTQTSNASEACPVQPQIAGQCGDGDMGNVTPDSGILCDFSDDDGVTFTNCPNPGPSGNPERCLTGGGCPKYGDYNGNACTGGKLFAAWASANSPPGVPPPAGPNNPGVLFDVINVAIDAPVITIPGGVHFGDTCSGETSFATLEVCNTGTQNLQVDTITSNNASFAVTVPSSGFPVTISPDFCFPFEVTFNPLGFGPQTATLTVPSDDPDRPTVSVDVTGNAERQRIVTVMDTSYGDVCLGEMKSQQLTILNDGGCDLTVNSISIGGADAGEFDLATVMSTPFVLQGGESVSMDVEFTPTGDVGGASASVNISSDDPSMPLKSLPLSGNSPPAAISTFIANNGSFGEVCAQAFFDLDLTVQNDGACPLEIDQVSIALGANAQLGDFVQPSGSAAGTVVEPANSVQIPLRFSPSAFDMTPPLLRMANVEVDSHTQFATSALATDVTPIDGVVPPPDINLAIANAGEFGEVCKGDHTDLALTLFNQGRCDLTISGIALLPDPDSFELPVNLTFPLVLSHDADFTVPVRFSPDVCFDVAEERTLQVTSNDPDEITLNIGISGASPCPNLVIDPAPVTGIYSFPATVVDTTGTLGCFAERTVTLRNNGACPLTIDDIVAEGVSGESADYSVTAPTLFPIILPSGEETLGVTVRFTPQADANPLAPSEVTGLLTVVSDDPDFPHTADLCGESVAQSGVRMLVTDISSGSPVIVDNVDSITLQSKGKNRPGPINLRFTDQPASSAMVCGTEIPYHVDQETLPSTATTGNNPKSSYEAKAKEGNLQTAESFELAQCEFRDFQLQLQSSNDPVCLLLPKGASCSTDGECCSGNCTGAQGKKTCK